MARTEENGTDYPAVLRESITVTGLLYGDASFNDWMPTLTQQTNGNFLFNAQYDPKDAQDILIDLAPDFNEVTLLYQQVSLKESAIEIGVSLDETVGLITKFSVQFSASGGTFVIRDPAGKSLADGVTLVDDATPGIWSITLSNPNKGTAEIQVTSNPRPGVGQVEVVTWTSASNVGQVDLTTEGLAFYVSVTQGNVPVINLQIQVTIYPAEGGSSALQVTLKDDGQGDPDVQFLDGVYSNYITSFDSLTFTDMKFFADVSITSDAHTKKETMVHIKNTRLGTLPYDPFIEEPCCGSKASGGIELSLFRHISGATTVEVINGPGIEPYNPPPSQITSAEISNVDQEGPAILAGTVLVTLTWQAPGKDFTDGTVSGYEIWYSDSKAEITSSFASCSLVTEYESGPPKPGPHGSLQTATIRLPKKVEKMTQYYLIVVGLDGTQRGLPSPLLGVTVSAGVPYTTESTQATTTTTQYSSSPETTTQTSSLTDLTTTTTMTQSSSTPDASSTSDAPSTPDASSTLDATSTPDASITPAASSTPDASSTTDVSSTSDASSTPDASSTQDATTPTSMTQTSSSSDATTPTTSQTSTSSDTTSEDQTSTSPKPSTQTPVTHSSSTIDPATGTTISTSFTETTTLQQPTDPPPGFVGSTEFWIMTGGLILLLLLIIILTIYCCRKRRVRLQPSKPQRLNPKNEKKGKKGKLSRNNTRLYDSVRVSVTSGEEFKTSESEDVEKGLAAATTTATEPQPPTMAVTTPPTGTASSLSAEAGVDNNGFEGEGTTEADSKNRSNDDSSDEDMITSL
ncbi:serine-rich adhesin for platelets-like [Macrobrachium rosenbergii]|uniref:serine-rich adhesin for platelets-like n=1 Tax=Macrobrachium rosenbergii TaxID=79674 RepID=UPI0034D65023